MPLGRPTVQITLSEKEKAQLQAIADSRLAGHARAQPARMVLAAAKGQTNVQIAKREKVVVATVGKWRWRYAEQGIEGLLDLPRGPGLTYTGGDAKRLTRLRRFYRLLAKLEKQLGGARLLAECDGRMNWPERGIYFFFEPGQQRHASGSGMRVVRVGTHALKAGAKSKLWNRLSQHRGPKKDGIGDHSTSIFRQHVGQALINREGLRCPGWGRGGGNSIRGKRKVELGVSEVIGAMPFLWLAIGDKPGPKSKRGYIERNAIALLSNHGKRKIDRPSSNWLGLESQNKLISKSGLWNCEHVDEECDPEFLDVLEKLILRMK